MNIFFFTGKYILWTRAWIRWTWCDTTEPNAAPSSRVVSSNTPLEWQSLRTTCISLTGPLAPSVGWVAVTVARKWCTENNLQNRWEYRYLTYLHNACLLLICALFVCSFMPSSFFNKWTNFKNVSIVGKILRNCLLTVCNLITESKQFMPLY